MFRRLARSFVLLREQHLTVALMEVQPLKELIVAAGEIAGVRGARVTTSVCREWYSSVG